MQQKRKGLSAQVNEGSLEMTEDEMMVVTLGPERRAKNYKNPKGDVKNPMAR